jgi:hypothetical protein
MLVVKGNLTEYDVMNRIANDELNENKTFQCDA